VAFSQCHFLSVGRKTEKTKERRGASMKFLKLLDDKLEEILMVILLIGIVVFMSAQVISRRIFNDSLTWTDELTRYLLVWSAFLSISYCVKRRISIKITQFQNMLPERAIPFVKIIRHTIVFVFCLVMLPFCWTYVQQAINSGATSAALQIPMYYIQSAPLVGFLLLIVRVGQAWVREFHASWKSMVQTMKDEIHAETREEMLAEEQEEERGESK
jgi:TRAP-type C4-dicarboxylate transport system permease small subunit